MKRFQDLKGYKIGMLVVTDITDKRSYKGSVIWRCRCACGNMIELASDDLLSERYMSCGCKREEWQKQIHKTLHHVENTCVEYLEKRNHRLDNKSGYQGVQKLKNGRYRSTIGFNGKRYHLGYYNTFEEAVAVRKEGEKKLHSAFVDYYYEWKRHADNNPDWAKEHTLKVEVEINKKTKEIDVRITF